MHDRHHIGQVMIRYATSVDQRDLDRYAACFTDDVTVTGFSGGEIVGLADYIPWVASALERFRGTHHQITNQEIDLDGDAAHMRSYVQATHELADDPDTLLVLWAIYDDHLIRTVDGWRITHHHLERLIDSRKIATT